MAGNRHKLVKDDKKLTWNLKRRANQYCNKEFAVEFLTDPRHIMTVGWILLAVEFVLNCVIVRHVSYTEIDWIAYMQQCEGFLNGTLDYTKIKGDTGPLVYPAGFVYLYSMLYYLTSHGKNIYVAQCVFIGVYLTQLYLTLRLYARTRKVPPYALVLTTLTSYRIHSVYALRLFNDSWAVLLMYAALNAFLAGRWWLGSTFYTLAVSIKMNCLLYAPCVLAAYIACAGGFRAALKHITWCAVVQLLLGAPFLYENFWGYIFSSFDVGRVFEYRWTVNWRFLDRATFESRYLHVSLLLVHVGLLLAFLPAMWRYLTSYSKLKQIETQLRPQLDPAAPQPKKRRERGLSGDQQRFLDAYEGALKRRSEDDAHFTVDFSSSAQLFILPMFVTNLIGVVCARSLHYQFYSWYFHSLLYLTWCTGFKRPMAFLLLAIIEFCWNTYPSTTLSSAALHLCHGALLFGVYRTMARAAKSSASTK